MQNSLYAFPCMNYQREDNTKTKFWSYTTYHCYSERSAVQRQRCALIQAIRVYSGNCVCVYECSSQTTLCYAWLHSGHSWYLLILLILLKNHKQTWWLSRGYGLQSKRLYFFYQKWRKIRKETKVIQKLNMWMLLKKTVFVVVSDINHTLTWIYHYVICSPNRNALQKE